MRVGGESEAEVIAAVGGNVAIAQPALIGERGAERLACEDIELSSRVSRNKSLSFITFPSLFGCWTWNIVRRTFITSWQETLF
ncbi:MAG: hypothetical protein DME22_19210 [Verrucomicrobia bacterium]|nr:MAG: hypothetical protein DME22_19210 [Verrucomicrobiota bacterium]PYJ95823.1 MAG: hypothetical protein DME23_22705 [Verrucomicrobiota bacterium]